MKAGDTLKTAVELLAIDTMDRVTKNQINDYRLSVVRYTLIPFNVRPEGSNPTFGHATSN